MIKRIELPKADAGTCKGCIYSRDGMACKSRHEKNLCSDDGVDYIFVRSMIK